MRSLTAKEKKLFPIHDPLFHVQLEISTARDMIDALGKVLLASSDDMTPEADHWFEALDAMVKKSARHLEQTEIMLATAREIAKRGGAVAERGK